MPAIPLRLRTAALPLPVCAGWLPGADPAAWLAEARRLVRVSAGAVIKFYPLARSAQDLTASGVIITVTGGAPDLCRAFGPQVQWLGEIFPGVLVPVHSVLEPALTEAERHRFFPWSIHFIHPVLGLTGFEERDALLPPQLLAALPQEQAGWFAAVPGPAVPPPLRQLTLVQESSSGEWLAGEGGDIASQRPDKEEAPPGSGLLAKAGGFAAGMLGALGAGMSGAFGNSKGASPFNQGSRRQPGDLQERRQRELDKLLDRFDKDTLDALRHAIPLTGAGSRRGNAETPGWKLGMRNPDPTTFSQGGGAVDVWNIPSATRLKLEKRYREAATREAASSQWGRAAYIYGELLGDWNQAAEMLEKGGRPREAARIYSERLRSGRRAAQCMEKAGLLAEAATLYREAGDPEKAGDLMAALGQLDAARELWETVLEKCPNPLEQARLLETKLHDPDRALTALKTGWPASGQALQCFEAWFALLGRLGRHQSAAACLDQLEQHRSSRLALASSMVTGLYTIYSAYPDHTVRDQAAALAPTLIGEALTMAPPRAETGRLLALLPRFSPGDRLLARDAGRYSLTSHHPVVPLLMESQATVLRPGRVISLDPEVTWESIADSWSGPQVAGWSRAMEDHPDSIHPITRGVLHDPVPQKLGWPVFLQGPPRLNHLVCRGPGGITAFHSRTARLAGWRTDRCLVVPGAMAMGQGNDGELILLHTTPTGILAANYYGPEGMFRRTRLLDFAPPGMEHGDWFTGGHGRDLWIAGMAVVCCVTEQTEFQHAAIRGPITAFAPAPPEWGSQAVAVGAGGAVLVIPHGPGKAVEVVSLYSGTAAKPPLAVFTGDGRAIIADANGGIAYPIRGSCRKRADIVVPPDCGGLVAAAAIGARGFAFLTSTGKVLGYEF